MAAPNIVNVTTITAKQTYTVLSSTSATSVLSNAAASGKAFKVNSLVVANVTGVAATITISVNSAAAGGGTAYRLAYQISVPGNASLIVIDKSTGIYLEEDRSIVATAGTSNALEVNIAYEELS